MEKESNWKGKSEQKVLGLDLNWGIWSVLWIFVIFLWILVNWDKPLSFSLSCPHTHTPLTQGSDVTQGVVR